MSFFISRIPLAGLMSSPPESKHTPFPTRVRRGAPESPQVRSMSRGRWTLARPHRMDRGVALVEQCLSGHHPELRAVPGRQIGHRGGEILRHHVARRGVDEIADAGHRPGLPARRVGGCRGPGEEQRGPVASPSCTARSDTRRGPSRARSVQARGRTISGRGDRRRPEWPPGHVRAPTDRRRRRHRPGRTRACPPRPGTRHVEPGLAEKPVRPTQADASGTAFARQSSSRSAPIGTMAIESVSRSLRRRSFMLGSGGDHDGWMG